MSLIYTANLIFIIVLNVLFFFSGICLNSLVIVSFWRSAQLRKKLCYFAIMLLSCCDLLVVLTSTQFMILSGMLWLTNKFNVYTQCGSSIPWGRQLHLWFFLQMLFWWWVLIDIWRHLIQSFNEHPWRRRNFQLSQGGRGNFTTFSRDKSILLLNCLLDV